MSDPTCNTRGTICKAMRLALDGADPKDQTGLVVCGLLPPHPIGVRYKTETRGEYNVLIFTSCPFCGEKLAGGIEKDPDLLHLPGGDGEMTDTRSRRSWQELSAETRMKCIALISLIYHEVRGNNSNSPSWRQ